MGRPEEGGAFLQVLVFPGMMIPIVAILRIAILIELCIHPWAYPAYDIESSHYPSFFF